MDSEHVRINQLRNHWLKRWARLGFRPRWLASVLRGMAAAYFGFGALMNRISLRMRGVEPARSCAAVLRGFRLAFGGNAGMATVFPGVTSDEVHGVLHYVSPEEKARLDISEASYDRVEAKVEIGEGDLMSCVVNVMRPEAMREFCQTLPSERYLAVMVEGCLQHGVCEAWADMLRTHACVPRVHPDSFLAFPEPPPNVYVNEAQLSVLDGRGGAGIGFAVNGKVYRFVGDERSDRGACVLRQLRAYGAGVDHTFCVAMEYYEPLFGEPRSLATLTTKHRAFCEHQLVMQYCGLSGCAMDILEPVGWVLPSLEGR